MWNGGKEGKGQTPPLLGKKRGSYSQAQRQEQQLFSWTVPWHASRLQSLAGWGPPGPVYLMLHPSLSLHQAQLPASDNNKIQNEW